MELAIAPPPCSLFSSSVFKLFFNILFQHIAHVFYCCSFSEAVIVQSSRLDYVDRFFFIFIKVARLARSIDAVRKHTKTVKKNNT